MGTSSMTSSPEDDDDFRMDRTVSRVFHSFEEADEADRQEYFAMSPERRLAIVRYLRRGYYGESTHLEATLQSLLRAGVEFVVVGSFALAFHGRPRLTDDIDIFPRHSQENLERLRRYLSGSRELSEELSAAFNPVSNVIVRLGATPNRVDIITALPRVTAEEIWDSRVECEFLGMRLSFIGRDAFVKSKLAAGRLKDLADLEGLGISVASTSPDDSPEDSQAYAKAL